MPSALSNYSNVHCENYTDVTIYELHLKIHA